MSLATRCTACGTVFRVVQDQLKVSEGWVRCGRCSEVFNALPGLFDLERDTPPDWPAGVPPVQSESPPIATEDAHPSLEAAVAPPLDAEGHALTDKIDAQLMGSRESDHESTPATRISERDRLEFPDAQFDPEMLAEDTVDVQLPVGEGPWTAQPGIESADPPPAPTFVEHAQRRARWQSPTMRGLAALMTLALLAMLALQGVHHFRDVIAARWPETRSTLIVWCATLSCTIDAPRRIEDLTVENTALARAAMPDAFKLSVVLRNRGVAAVALPSVDLTLTDAGGQLVARRMLAPRDFRVTTTTVGAGAESALQLLFSAGAARVTGYTVEIFYP